MNEDELFILIEGELGARQGDEEVRLGVGGASTSPGSRRLCNATG